MKESFAIFTIFKSLSIVSATKLDSLRGWMGVHACFPLECEEILVE